MKIIIISDVHGNYDAFKALPEQDYNELWVLGDLVNYGPEPSLVLDYICKKASIVVQGNHDYATGNNDDSHWSPAHHELSKVTRQFTASNISNEQKKYLRNLPQKITIKRENTSFLLVHSIPSNPIYGRLSKNSDQWREEIATVLEDVILVGHTHTPFIRYLDDKIIVNPGSLGQPRDGNPGSSYAVWQDGKFELKSFSYNIYQTCQKIYKLPIELNIKEKLIKILQTGII